MIYRFLITLFAILVLLDVQGQQCGTITPKSHIENPLIINGQNKDQVQYYLNKTLSVKIWIIAVSYNNYSFGAEDYMPIWEELNPIFEQIGVKFEICIEDSIPDYSFNFLDLKKDSITNKNKEDQLLSQYYTPNVINVYYVDSIKNHPEGIKPAGYAYLPGGPDVIVLTKGSKKGTLIHEMGHFLGLYHTFENGFGNELVNGSNCETTGDLVCDTPADINGETDSTLCRYIDTQKDFNGDYYTPYLSNYMSYYRDDCKCRFTNGQYNRMAWILLNERNYLW